MPRPGSPGFEAGAQYFAHPLRHKSNFFTRDSLKGKPMPVRRSDSLSYTLASNLSATGAAVAIPGGEYTFAADGTAGGSTISLQVKSSNGTWIDVQIFSGSVVKSTSLPYTQTAIALPACSVRIAATGGSPSGLNSQLTGLG